MFLFVHLSLSEPPECCIFGDSCGCCLPILRSQRTFRHRRCCAFFVCLGDLNTKIPQCLCLCLCLCLCCWTLPRCCIDSGRTTSVFQPFGESLIPFLLTFIEALFHASLLTSDAPSVADSPRPSQHPPRLTSLTSSSFFLFYSFLDLLPTLPFHKFLYISFVQPSGFRVYCENQCVLTARHLISPYLSISIPTFYSLLLLSIPVSHHLSLPRHS